MTAAADAQGFYFASGCNVAGLSISPALGEALAKWIVDGKPAFDLKPMSIERFSASMGRSDPNRSPL